jgi:hypothetical protein
MNVLFLILLLGGAALVLAAVIAAAGHVRGLRIVFQAGVGVVALVLAWWIANKAGAFADEDPEGCSDCGESYAFGLALLVGNAIGWIVGTLVGTLGGALHRRQASGSPSR